MNSQKPTSWTCPFCNRPTTITDNDRNWGAHELFGQTKHGKVGIYFISVCCPNPKCREISLTVSFCEVKPGDEYPYLKVVRVLGKWTLCPDSNAKPQPDYIPEPIREDYYEACLIAEKSPKASATLSRRCLQGMIRDFWKIKKDRLIDEINALEERVDGDTWNAIKAIKDFGNIGAHMEKDIDLIIPVDPDEAQLLINMIEQLFEDWYIRQHQREQRMGLIVEKAKEKKKQKSQNSEG